MGGIIANLLWTLTACTLLPAPESVAIRGAIPSTVEEIEVIYSNGSPPSVSLRAQRETVPSQAVRPQDLAVDLLAHISTIKPFGECPAQVERTGPRILMHATGSSRGCGYLLPVQSDAQALDALSYRTLHIKGNASGPTTLALADKAAWQREHNLPVATVSGPFDLHIPLKDAAARLDLRRLVSVVVLPPEASHTIVIDELTLIGMNLRQAAAPPIGFWVWNYRHAISHHEEILNACLRQGCRRLLVQIPTVQDAPEIWTAYATLLLAAKSAAIEPFALDGYPEAIYDPAPLAQKIWRLRDLMPAGSLAGVQLDIEPYVLDDFFIDESGFVRYLAAIDLIKTTLDGWTRLSVVMPFWFTSKTVQGRPVAFSVMDLADEVAIMSYRTDVNDLLAIADDALRYGAMAGRPVWLAVETRPLPLERHLVLKQESRRDLADAYLDRSLRRVVLAPPTPGSSDWFRVSHRTTVLPDRLTFAVRSRSNVRAAISSLGTAVADTSFAGVLIHDLDGFLALPD